MSLRVGIDVGGTKCLGVALDGGTGTTLAEERVATPKGGDAIVDAVVGLVRVLESEAGRGAERVGVGLPGLVDRDGVLHFAPNLEDADGLGVRAALEPRLGVDVRVDNDATCATWGEARQGAATGMSDVVMVTLGTGIGGGLVLGGRLCRGANGFGGEVGHMVVDPDGPECPCGKRGCWERFASGSGLGRLGREAAAAGRGGRIMQLAGGSSGAVRGEHVAAAAAEGDPEAGAVMAELGGWVGLGLANLANILDPQAFVVGGGLVDIGPALLDPARAALDRLLGGSGTRPPIGVVAAQLGSRAGAIGAAWLDD